MEERSELPDVPAGERILEPNVNHPIKVNPDSATLSRTFHIAKTTSSSSSSPPDLVRHVQAAFKRHRPIGMMQSNSIKPRRVLAARKETSKQTNIKSHPIVNRTRNDSVESQTLKSWLPASKGMVSVIADNQDHVCITPPSECGTSTSTPVEITYPDATQRSETGLPMVSLSSNAIASSSLDHANSKTDLPGKVNFSSEKLAESHETEWDVRSQVDISDAINSDKHHCNFQSMEVNNIFRSECGSSYLTQNHQDHQHQLGKFLQKDLGNPMTQLSMAGSSCVTLTLNNSASAPRISSSAHSLQPQTLGSHSSKEPHGEVEVKLAAEQPSYHLKKPVEEEATNKSVLKSSCLRENKIVNDLPQEDNHLEESNATVAKSLPPELIKVSPTEAIGNSKSRELETVCAGKAPSTSRKKGYDPDMFFKVNGKLYQRLGKIGSGGSSEVHKVISSDCKIYALKKIKLKGRDYATAYGFCQEIEYLNRLKGKDNIIQLIDYEVTDKTLLQEVMNGSLSKKDSRVKDEGYVYMVLEYGEIDLAHMLSLKWKELNGSNANASIDENWLRFYWQQILQAVNTIHGERIVHSDLKPANFLLVRGSLKLIDFGIAKAIMSDTTNIQRDSQVGTLSYMSPEAFLCNEMDANGSTIKCGLPSDIWSLGCILYQMVYGRTPFSEYKTFLAKFKVITDPTHKITYEPVSNRWLLDLMKKCLAWDRNERWRIPQLLQHPFLVPPFPPELPTLSSRVQSRNLLQIINEACARDQEALVLCSQLQALLTVPSSVVPSDLSNPREHLRKLLYKISTTCNQLQDVLADL